MKKYMWIVFILIGIGLILYPKVKDEYYKRQEEKVLKNWFKVSKNLEIVDSEIGTSIEENEIDNENSKKEYEINETMVGIINIEKIDLYEPVLKDASESNLNIGVAWVEGTSQVGSVGNHVIAGHRSRTYGRHFNRLDELEIGDSIEIITKDTNFIYTVYDKFIVKAEDVWVLKDDGVDKVKTLITCDYRMKPTGRLIIKGKLNNNLLNNEG